MKTTNRILSIVASLVLFSCFFIVGCSQDSGTEPTPTQPEAGVAGDGNLAANLEYIRSQNNLPALAALMVRGGEIVEMAAVGLRAVGHPEQVTVNDRWHIGSITKSMTSTLAAVLVEKGTISWETTIADIFPDLVGTMRSEYVDVHLDELLSHTGGLKRDPTNVLSYVSDTSPITAQRRRVVAEHLTLPPEAQHGTYLYSNAGYIIAGAMLEAVTGQSWEELIQSNVFAPLGMSSTGFGAPGTAGQRDEPWGHEPDGNSWDVIDPGNLFADNPPVYGPAGTVHSTMSDLALYMTAHLAGARGTGGLVTKESFEKLHTPFPATEYALGWVVMDGQIWHDGSNTKWFAIIVIVPEIDGAFFVVTNAYDSRATRGAQEVGQVFDKRFKAAFGGAN